MSAGVLHTALLCSPTATALPSLRRSTVWKCPAAICVYTIPSSKGGISHCPLRFLPVATTVPSLRWQPQCLQQPGCRSIPRPKVGCCIVLCHCLQWQHRFHQSVMGSSTNQHDGRGQRYFSWLISQMGISCKIWFHN